MNPHGKNHPTPAARFAAAQARACAFGLNIVLTQALLFRQPADRCLATFLRENRKFGAHDRRLLSETIFAVMRWWGWLESLAPAAFREALRNRPAQAPAAGPADSDRRTFPVSDGLEWGPVLLAAHLLDSGRLPGVWREWAEASRLALHTPFGNLPPAEDPERRGKAVFALLYPEARARHWKLTDLVPAWAPAQIALPCSVREWVLWLQARPPVWLRVQGATPAQVRQELGDVGLAVEPHPVLAQALRVGTTRLNLRTLEAYRAGRVEVQDISSQMVAQICAPRPGERWWDACAGAGGKCLHLAELMQRKGTVVATDIRAYKLDDLKRRARRAHFPNIQCRAWDGQALPGRRATFDGVLVDAPCSCSGTWRRNPDARWNMEAAEIDEFQALQLRILRRAASGVAPGGCLVYATCSMFTRENRGVVDLFMAEHPAFELTPFPHPLTGETGDGTLQVWPWDADGDAMYMARFRRTAGH